MIIRKIIYRNCSVLVAILGFYSKKLGPFHVKVNKKKSGPYSLIYKGVKLTNPTSFMALVFSSPYSHALKSLETMITYNILPKSLEVALVDFRPDWHHCTS